jgi:hypothetical protein
VTDLDAILQPLAGQRPWEQPDTGWATEAESITQAVATARGLRVEWEPPDEEWLRLLDDHHWYGMVSTLFPLAVATRAIATDLRGRRPDLTVVEVSDPLTDELSASPDLLQATLLRYGWDDDFNPAAFCANDLFVESV